MMYEPCFVKRGLNALAKTIDTVPCTDQVGWHGLKLFATFGIPACQKAHYSFGCSTNGFYGSLIMR